LVRIRAPVANFAIPRLSGSAKPGRTPEPDVRDHVRRMSDERPPEILSSLPSTRPHRRSDKRASRPKAAPVAAENAAAPKQARAAPPSKPRAATSPKPRATASPKPRAATARRKTEPPRQPKQPAGNPPAPPTRRPSPVSGSEFAGTMVRAAAELAEIGLSVGARTLRNALSRLPRP
jgi:hypothetical protein